MSARVWHSGLKFNLALIQTYMNKMAVGWWLWGPMTIFYIKCVTFKFYSVIHSSLIATAPRNMTSLINCINLALFPLLQRRTHVGDRFLAWHDSFRSVTHSEYVIKMFHKDGQNVILPTKQISVCTAVTVSQVVICLFSVVERRDNLISV